MGSTPTQEPSFKPLHDRSPSEPPPCHGRPLQLHPLQHSSACVIKQIRLSKAELKFVLHNALHQHSRSTVNKKNCYQLNTIPPLAKHTSGTGRDRTSWLGGPALSWSAHLTL
ncbi:hypothetical protein CRENBAI_006238 [Crenichthys baileyi]|uniref:Uncharacterized protein n=1 Tax=Crenichthys baileyi TaxID=28760 RepID=A0AAV9QMF8_9TELE